jgi:Transcription factor zinc-finger
VWEPGKPSQNEDEYFARRDAEWLRERREALDAERAAKEIAEKRPKCPRCGEPLLERTFRNLKLDMCIAGHGAWLDAGELEMVLHLPRAELLRVVGDVESGSRSK